MSMKVVHVNAEAQRNACLARLCAEVYGQAAGLTPLVVFTGTCSVLSNKWHQAMVWRGGGQAHWFGRTSPSEKRQRIGTYIELG